MHRYAYGALKQCTAKHSDWVEASHYARPAIASTAPACNLVLLTTRSRLSVARHPEQRVPERAATTTLAQLACHSGRPRLVERSTSVQSSWSASALRAFVLRSAIQESWLERLTRSCVLSESLQGSRLRHSDMLPPPGARKTASGRTRARSQSNSEQRERYVQPASGFTASLHEAISGRDRR